MFQRLTDTALLGVFSVVYSLAIVVLKQRNRTPQDGQRPHD